MHPLPLIFGGVPLKEVVRVTGIGKNSLQGDIHFASCLKEWAVLENGAIIHWGDDYIECERWQVKGIDMDMNTIPDAAMTIATTALFAEGERLSVIS